MDALFSVTNMSRIEKPSGAAAATAATAVGSSSSAAQIAWCAKIVCFSLGPQDLHNVYDLGLQCPLVVSTIFSVDSLAAPVPRSHIPNVRGSHLQSFSLQASHYKLVHASCIRLLRAMYAKGAFSKIIPLQLRPSPRTGCGGARKRTFAKTHKRTIYREIFPCEVCT